MIILILVINNLLSSFWIYISGDINLSFAISLLSSVFSLFCDEAIIILSAILLPMKSPVASFADFLALPRNV